MYFEAGFYAEPDAALKTVFDVDDVVEGLVRQASDLQGVLRRAGFDMKSAEGERSLVHGQVRQVIYLVRSRKVSA